MAVLLGDRAPNFEGETTGHDQLHDWRGDSRGVLFSHPNDAQTPPLTRF